MSPQVRRFGRKALFFLATLVIAFCAVEWRLAQTPNRYDLRSREIAAQAASVDVLVLGNSQASLGIRPDAFSSHAFNLASFSESLVLNEKLFRRYVDRMPSLKAVVLQISYFSFNFKTSFCPEAWRNYYYARYYHTFEQLDWPGWLSPKTFSLYFLYGRALSRKLLLHPDPKLSKGLMPNGWEIHPREADHDHPIFAPRAGAEQVAGDNAYLSDDHFLDDRRAFESLLAQAVGRGIRVAILETPMMPEYFAGISPNLLERNRRLIAETIRPYDGKVVYRDYKRDPRITEPDFLDSYHLNSKGATRFSPIVNSELVAPLLAHSEIASFEVRH